MRSLIGLVLTLAVLAATGFVCARQGDLESAGDEDLAVVIEPELPPARNVWPGLLEAAALVPLDEAEARSLDTFAAGDGAAMPAELRARVEASAPVIAAAARALDRPARQVEPAGGAEDDLSEIRAVQDLARLAVAHALLRARAGDAEGALRGVRLALRVGAALHGIPGGNLVHGMIGISIQEQALEVWLAALPSLDPDAGHSARWAAELARHTPEREGWRRVWAGEYAGLARVFDEVDVGLEAENAGWKGPVPAEYLYHPNRTRREVASRYRALADWTGDGCRSAYPFPDPPDPLGIRELLGPNAIGSILSRVASPDYQRYGERACALEALRAAARVATALRAHQVARGTLPAELSELVPEYLGELPRDPWRDEPLGWSDQRRRLWSVGADRVDAGGTDSEDDRSRLDEPTFALAF